MNRLMKAALLAVAGMLAAGAAQAADAPGTRTIHLLQDDAQVRFVSKMYELKNVRPTDVVPYVYAAVKRYSANSTVQRVVTAGAAKGAILVTTGRDFMPFVDDLVAKIDRPGKADEYGSLIEGTGITRISYTPKYRAAKDLPMLIRDIFGSPECSAYLDESLNTIYWKDEHNSALATLAWLQYLDRPLPQAEVRINYYELRESTLRDIGFDYLAWKNGPGVNFFNVGYNAGHLAVNEAFKSLITHLPEMASTAAKFSSTWGYGGFFTAPQFDMSFIRILQQSGSAKVVGHATLMMTNTPVSSLSEMTALQAQGDASPYCYSTSVTPQYQDIAKTNEGRSYIGHVNDYAELNFTAYNPIVCFASGTGTPVTAPEAIRADMIKGAGGGVIFRYSASFRNVVERGDTGSELANKISVTGGATLGFRKEQLIAMYEKDTDVEQTIGFPFFGKLPILKYICSTTTTIKEHTYIVITAEANPVDPAREAKPASTRIMNADDRQWWER